MNPSVSTLQKAEKEITIDFPIEKVKSSIIEVSNKFGTKYLLKNDGINEVFNTYHFSISNNLNPALADVSLQKIDESKTKLTISVTNCYGSLSSNSILAGLANDYLLVLGKFLSGESIESIKETVKNSGCMILILIGIASIALMSFIAL